MHVMQPLRDRDARMFKFHFSSDVLGHGIANDLPLKVTVIRNNGLEARLRTHPDDAPGAEIG